MIKDGTFFTVQSFMVTQLGLSGNDLLVYAIIYGFSQDGESVFRGSRQYLADWCNSTVRGIQKNLNRLMELGLIEQVYHSADNHEVHYKAITTLSEQSSLHKVNKVHRGDEQSASAIDNIADNIVNNTENTSTKVEVHPDGCSGEFMGDTVSVTPTEKKKENKRQKILTTSNSKKPNLYERCTEEVAQRYEGGLKYVLLEYLDYRIKSKLHPLGFPAWKGMLNKLDKLAEDDKTRSKVVEQSLKMGWDTFVELKEWNKKPVGRALFGETTQIKSKPFDPSQLSDVEF